MSSYQQDRSEAGLDRIRLCNRYVDLCILPEVGGKILKLIDRRSGHNWLWENPHIAPTRSRVNADFNCDQDSGGWDEVLLSIKPGEISTDSGPTWCIPDHGDVIGRCWSVDELRAAPDGDAVCDMVVAGDAMPYEFRRTLRLLHGEPRIEVGYSLTNNGPSPMPAYWCAHTLLAAGPDTRIELPGDMPLRVDDAATRERCQPDNQQRWPVLQFQDGSEKDLSQSFASNGSDSGFASKIFVRSPECGSVDVLTTDTGARLALRFDPELLPWLGLWINNRGWSGCDTEPYLNLGVEPATSPYDSVSEAIRNDSVDWLQPGETKSWSLHLEFHQ